MELYISQLIEYAVRKGWISDTDRIWAANRILAALHMDGFGGLVPVENADVPAKDPDDGPAAGSIDSFRNGPAGPGSAAVGLPPLQEILGHLCDYAYEHGVIDGNTAAYRDLLDTELMGLLIPAPSEVISRFREKYAVSPEAATGWYYAFSGDTNYIRRDRIAKDVQWPAETDYGTLDITINLSKPEKDPKAIAAAAKIKAGGYPKCLLCPENEGYAGRLDHPARQNHRMIPIRLNGADFFLQYSPYVYYNEHCIVLNREHVPMHIDETAFRNLLDFVTVFPHYFIGSNADLPIVGGSVLSHDHYQGGRFEFAMERAPLEEYFTVPGFEDVHAGIVRWPMSVIRLRAADRERLIRLAVHILEKWRAYDDPAAEIYHETDGEPHSTITPIARRRRSAGDMDVSGEAARAAGCIAAVPDRADYELDLVLRNNRTTAEYPLGIFHPHAEKHHIKKENIGLIEVMGLAVLPARLKEELAAVGEGLAEGKELSADPRTAAHADWAKEVQTRHPELSSANVDGILRQEVGKVFASVLEDAGVFKRTESGRDAFRRFIAAL